MYYWDIDMDILRKYISLAYTEQLARDYKEKGYRVGIEKKIGNLQVDFVAEKKGERIIYEIKDGEMTPAKQKHILKIKRMIDKLPNTKFKLAIVNPPRKIEIEIEDITLAFHKYLNNNIPSEIDTLATHARIDDVSDIEVESVYVKKETIALSGSGFIGAELQHGSDSDADRDDGLQFSMTFPFTFDLTLNRDLDIEEVEELSVDTSSFYE